jgi:GntR family transcriptional regulator
MTSPDQGTSSGHATPAANPCPPDADSRYGPSGKIAIGSRASTLHLTNVMTFVRYDMSWNAQALETGPIPLWFQIADRLRGAIERGEFKPGDALPSEAKLNEAFGVSRTTARASLDRLEHEGLITRRSGRGSIVLSPRVEQPLNVLAGFAEDMRRRGLTPSYELQSARIAAATGEVARALDIREGGPAFRLNRLFKADEVPIAASVAWIPLAVLPNHTPPPAAELGVGSLYAWLEERCGMRIVGGHEFIEAAVAGKALAQSLGIKPGSAVLVARRRSHGADGQPIEYAIMQYRADRYRFRVDLVRP